MAIEKVGSPKWLEWGYGSIGDACCFLCGIAFLEGESVVLWAGISDAKKIPLPFAPYDFGELNLMDTIAKSSGGFQQGLNIFFHIACVPSFCRRLLEDWERSRN